MSQISDIYNYLTNFVGTNLPSYVELPDRIDPEVNPSVMLDKGFAVVFGEEANLNKQLCPFLTLERSFTFILSNEITTTIHDTEGRKTLEKNIVEDAYTLINALGNDVELGGNAVDASYISQTAVEYLVDQEGTDRYLVVSIEIAVEYHQEI